MSFIDEDGAMSPDALHILCHVAPEHVVTGGARMSAGTIRALATQCLLLMGERNELKAELDRLWKGRTS